MSSRLYPVYKEGSQRLRIFLPNFWMKLVKPDYNLLPNQAMFIVSPQMTRFDVQQYLEKIYKVPVVTVNIYNRIGKTKMFPNRYVTKEVDDKIAIVSMPADQKFEFPEIFGKDDAEAKAQDSMDEVKAAFEKKTKINTSKQGIPSWFSH